MAFIELWRRPWAWSARPGPGSTALRAANWLNDYVLGPRFRRHLQICNLAVFDLAFHRRLIGCVEFEIGRPVGWPSGQQQDALAVTLHQHQLQRDHARAAAFRVP